MRPHRALKFGREVRTPARQAGLTKRALTLREIFSSRELFLASKNVLFALFETVRPVSFPIRGVRSGGLATIDDGSTITIIAKGSSMLLGSLGSTLVC